MIVAEQVVARARRRARHERGQHPDGRRRGPRGARAVRAARREASAASRSSSRAASRSRSRSTYHGELAEYDTRLLTVAALNGAFRGRVDQPVNYVNAPLIAAERGIEVVEERRRASRDFTNLIVVGTGDVARRRHDDRHREPPVARRRRSASSSRSSSRRG